VDARLKAHFYDHDIHWAFTSRIVRHHLKKRSISTILPSEMIANLADQGHRWAVVQSFNMICGHEFHRLINDVQHDRCRISIGHSLLCSQKDHHNVAQALSPVFSQNDQEAVVLVGHGTDHCTWTVYPAFYQRLRKMYGKRAYGGMIEEDYPARAMLIDKIKSDGFRRVRLLPFMLVAGMHFEEDLAGSEDSWKTAFIRYKDTETNRKTLLDLIRESSQQGARIILTPEMAIAGYSYDSRRAIGPFLEALNSPTLTLIREAAQTYVVCVCMYVSVWP
jgi:sirohydrochlorin cobaltochelatase